MSRYIRTENGVYEVKKEVIVDNVENENASYFPNQDGYFVYSKNNFSGEFIPKVDIIEESDNLTDLLDGYIIAYENNRYSYYDNELNARQVFAWERGCYAIFLRGVIGTDEGLKYIAKFNYDKKEWELE